ncbi:MAG TPA: hypothetical protein DCR14_08830 [Acidimicrobiaceae bacterium]|nr:hypothetical protein [Acidimicrobiaceae bacterium]
MSWLLDRLTGLAVADRLTIVVDTAADRSGEFGGILRRAATVEGTSVVSAAARSAAQQPVRGEVRLVVASSDRGEPWFRALRSDDLGVSVGAASPGADVRVDGLHDAATLIDTLVTLRTHAMRAIA